ncbi:MAG: AAA family ATPase, partial [Lentimicrobium sp.]|nr:AAA family ATPase [Lentimicrobium sp.]
PNLTSVFGNSQPGSLPLVKVIQPITENLYIAPSSLDMAAVELGINARLGREYILAEAIEGLKGFDLVIIDCPPSLSLLVINALAASNAVLIPCQPMPVDVAALRLFLKTVESRLAAGANGCRGLPGCSCSKECKGINHTSGAGIVAR